jgi:hypothetical protein
MQLSWQTPSLQRGGTSGSPASPLLLPTSWGCSSRGRAPRLHRGGAGSTPAVSTRAFVVSTASTRPLYGRGAGSTPAEGSSDADVAQREERRSATPKRPVRSGPSASQACGVTGSTASSNLAGPGSNPGGPAPPTIVAGRSVRVISSVERPPHAAERFDTAIPIAPHDRDVTPAAGRNGAGYRLLIDRSRVRVPPGAFELR